MSLVVVGRRGRQLTKCLLLGFEGVNEVVHVNVMDIFNKLEVSVIYIVKI